MRGTPASGNVHAKTGFVDRARSLSGYVTTADGENSRLQHVVQQLDDVGTRRGAGTGRDRDPPRLDDHRRSPDRRRLGATRFWPRARASPKRSIRLGASARSRCRAGPLARRPGSRAGGAGRLPAHAAAVGQLGHGRLRRARRRCGRGSAERTRGAAASSRPSPPARFRRRGQTGTCTRIMTGAPLPEGADSVMRVEDTDGGPPRDDPHGARLRAATCGRAARTSDQGTVVLAGAPRSAPRRSASWRRSARRRWT